MTRRTNPTSRQEEVLRFLLEFQERMGRVPTGPEIAREFGFADHSTAYQHLRALQSKGYIELIQEGTRLPLGIRFTESARALMRRAWPLLGAIPAGPLSESFDDARQHIERVEDLVPGIRPGDYFLVVQGDSMIDEGIEPGHYVLIRPDKRPRNGAICAVWVDGEGGTLKRVYQQGKKIRLEPANPRYKPQTFPSDRVRIQGVMVAALAVKKG